MEKRFKKIFRDINIIMSLNKEEDFQYYIPFSKDDFIYSSKRLSDYDPKLIKKSIMIACDVGNKGAKMCLPFKSYQDVDIFLTSIKPEQRTFYILIQNPVLFKIYVNKKH